MKINEEEPFILHEGQHFFVAFKPAGLLSHPTRKTPQRSLIGYFREKRPREYLTLVHRLDRETSGILLVAKNPITAGALGKLVEARKIEKEYFGITYGEVLEEHGRINFPLGFLGVSEKNRVVIKQGIIENGAEALTEFWRQRVYEKGGGKFTLLRIKAHTGRLHQIRVHLSLLGHSLVGDKIYGPSSDLFLEFIEKGWTKKHEKLLLMPRHALHASSLEFSWQKERLHFFSPIPQDMIEFLL